MTRRDVDKLQEEIEELFADLWQVPRFSGIRRGFRRWATPSIRPRDRTRMPSSSGAFDTWERFLGGSPAECSHVGTPWGLPPAGLFHR